MQVAILSIKAAGVGLTLTVRGGEGLGGNVIMAKDWLGRSQSRPRTPGAPAPPFGVQWALVPEP